MKNIIAFWGYPAPDIIKDLKNQYPNAEWLDLDIDFGYPDVNILPDAYCKIIKNVINNVIYLKDKIIKVVATVGKDKCDSGWFAGHVLKDLGFDVIESKFESKENKNEIIISTSNLPLYEKITKITDNIIEPKFQKYEQCKPQFGFWGVPPNDLEILKLFPNNTHVYGWTRCVEAGTPADIELEMYVDKNIPTVFYSQAFCAKSQLAKYLANKYNGLYIDIDDYATNSIKAKIEAFLRLR
ncbi:hypothetical protein KBA27_03890 [bacterium]|nr:hypothetical protein [bacterium]